MFRLLALRRSSLLGISSTQAVYPNARPPPKEAERSPRIVKYLRLESYEDALDSIDFDQPTDQLHLPVVASDETPQHRNRKR